MNVLLRETQEPARSASVSSVVNEGCLKTSESGWDNRVIGPTTPMQKLPRRGFLAFPREEPSHEQRPWLPSR